jgi:hypothetical protein
MSKETEIIYELKQPFKYTPKNSGDQVDAQFIKLSEPSVKNLEYCSILKQAFMRVIADQDNSIETGETDASTVEEDDIALSQKIINSLYTSKNDITQVFVCAKELFRQVGLVDGEKQLTMPMIDEMSIDDLESMTGLYMANFILASVLEDQ